MPFTPEIPMAILVAFDKHYFEAHVPIVKKIPGLRKYEVSRPWRTQRLPIIALGL
jgi:uncharacterized protein (TIGR02118 family)